MQSLSGDKYDFCDPNRNPFIRNLFSRDLLSLLMGVVNKLPPRTKDAFLLAYVAGLPHKQIAMLMGISLSTVENHIYNALKYLRSKISEME